MLIGAHESIAGGIEHSPDRAVEDRCEVMQIFTGPPLRWDTAPLTGESISAFRNGVVRTGLESVIVHGAYLINPATPDAALRQRSGNALLSEYMRCAELGVDYLVIHPGSHRGSGASGGIVCVAALLDELFDSVKEGPLLLLENTAGSGHALGGSFNELSKIRERVMCSDRVAYCFDTAHAFAAGYDISGEEGLEHVFVRFDSEAGVDLIKVFHLNDTLKPLGSRVDRHARIGEGILGLVPFARLLQDARFTQHPGILETPPLTGAGGRYRPQVRTLVSLREGVSVK